MTTRAGNNLPRYTTFATGELQEALRSVTPPEVPLPANAEEVMRSGSRGSSGGSTRIAPVKAHEFKTTLTDGTEGICRYERLGPALHRFHYKDAEGIDLPKQWHTNRLDGTVADIERAGKEVASAAFRDAIARERAEYFCRASESPTRKKRPELYQMDAKRAKELGGRYLLCYLLPSGKCFPASVVTHSTLDEANVAWSDFARAKVERWKRHENPPTSSYSDPVVVACCNRLDRCWDLPRYNTLYKDFDPRHRECPRHREHPRRSSSPVHKECSVGEDEPKQTSDSLNAGSQNEESEVLPRREQDEKGNE